MTVSLVALYRKPQDPAAFLDHYERVHAPLVRNTPHLESMTVCRVTSSPMGTLRTS